QMKQRTLTGALVAVRKPTIAALPGPAAGAGLALALACDIRIAAESAIMATGYARIGLTGDYGIAWLLTRLVGTSRARELMFLSERIDARRCEALGLVNRVVPDAELPYTAYALAGALARSPDRVHALERELPDTHAMICDVSSESQVADAVANIRKSYGVPNVLIHNAVGGGWGTFLEIAPEMLERNFRVNVMGLLYLAREVAPAMIEAGDG